jgi:cytoskeletal protein CcmA (bactofilin family)
VADEPKPEIPNMEQPATAPAAPAPEGANISPAPTSVSGMDFAAAKAGIVEPPPTGAAAPAPASTMPADPLNDGTVPTVLATGTSHKSVPKGKVSIASIYRKADVLTTVFTFVGAVVAAAAILGVYAYLTRAKAPTTVAPKVATLDKSDLDKLSAFFDGNSAGGSSQVLTISSSSLFKNRVAVSSDLKVVGGLQVSGTTALGDLTVDKTSTLGVTNIRGSLVVAGPVNFQSPAQFGAGGTMSGNLAVTGNGSFGGSISAGTLNVRDISVSGTINLAGHLSISGQASSVTPLGGAGSGASATIDGNDSSGTVTINAGSIANSATPDVQLATITFRSAYPRVPHIVITPIGASSGHLEFFILKTAAGFTIGAAAHPSSNTSYSFDYWVVQ